VGQKTHPLGFRLGITQEHKSSWFIPLNKYSILLEEDYKIRTYFNSKLFFSLLSKFNFENSNKNKKLPILKTASISNIKINRSTIGDFIEIIIETAKPGLLVGVNNSIIQALIIDLKKILFTDKQIKITINQIQNADLDANLIGEYVLEQLEKRIAFKRVMKNALQRAQNSGVRGIKIQVSGRLNGAEMARSEYIREGQVPLHTLIANIDYSSKEAHTIYGILGIKVWLFKN